MTLKVKGLGELSRAFKKTDEDLPSKLKTAFRAIAEQVANKAKGKLPSKSGRAASSIVPRSTTKGAGIAFGGAKAPYMPWLDFGGSTGRGHQTGKAWSGAIRRDWMGRPVGEGRYIYPAISEEREHTREAVDHALKTVAEDAGFETTGEI